jgi:uncharacterized protein YozE (UPF0346 family)
MKLTFKEWLFKQKERKDAVGRLARAMDEVDFSYVKPRRKPDEHKKWANIVTRHGKPEHVLTFNRAWREYQTANEQ